MFTIKFYSADGHRSVIREADSFTVLRGADGSAEITLHQKSGEDYRIDIEGLHPAPPREEGWPPIFSKAIIENASGKTTEVISALTCSGAPRPISMQRPVKGGKSDWMGC